MTISARDRLIVALDVPSLDVAQGVVTRLGDSVSFYKIGYQLAFIGGFDLARKLIGQGKQVFVDLKLHDIGNTVEKGVESVARLGATFLTVHAYPQTMKAALAGKANSKLKILAVTVLTSYDDQDLSEAGYAGTVSELVKRRAKQARELGVDGLVCSAEEAAALRGVIENKMVLVTPGIRPAIALAGVMMRF
jgi:orotidine-5'-phosphate decarboxylase